MDFFKVYFNWPGSIVYVSLGPSDYYLPGLPADYDLYLYGPDLTLLDSSARPGTIAEEVRAIAIASGYYYVKVQGAGGAFSQSPYRLSVAPDLATPTPAPTPVDPDDPYEPNDIFQDTYFLSGPSSWPGQVVESRIYPAGDVDIYGLTLVLQRKIRFSS